MTEFVPADIDATVWENLQPYYKQLLNREFKCSGCIEQFFLTAANSTQQLDEAGSNLYITMTCNTEDEDAKKQHSYGLCGTCRTRIEKGWF